MTLVDFPEDFFRLRAKWEEGHPERGGSNALAGFDFQLTAALVEVIRNFDVDHPGSVFVESLSDHVRRQGGIIFVTQAKLTLHSGALRKALDGLWAIEKLAREVTPNILHLLKYCVVAAHSDLKNWQG